MAVQVRNFLGRDITIPNDRLYDAHEGLWIKKREDGAIEIGITEPSILVAGMVREAEPLSEAGTTVAPGETVMLVLTSKLMYIASPISGVIGFPDFSAEVMQRLAENPYSVPLFSVVASEDTLPGLADAEKYADSLKDSEGSRNPGGRKGGVSPTCKAVYMGIGQQSLRSDTD